MHGARGLAAGRVRAQVLDLDRQVVRLAHPQVGARPAAGRALEDDGARRQRPRRLQAKRQAEVDRMLGRRKPGRVGLRPELLRERVKAGDQPVPRSPEILFAPCLTLSSASNTARPWAGARTGGRGPGPALPPPGTAPAPARTYSPRPTLASGVPAELAGPPGALRAIPWNTGSRLGRSRGAARIAPPDPLIHADPRERLLPHSRQRPCSLQDQPLVLSSVPGHDPLPPSNTITPTVRHQQPRP